MDGDLITAEVVDAALAVHRRLGPGLLESVYEALLAAALSSRGLEVERQRVLPFTVDGMEFREGLRVDLLVEKRVVVELKSIERLLPVHTKQVLTYLRLLQLPTGLLINFGGATLKEGVKRVVNNYIPPDPDGGRSPRLPVRLRASA